MNRRLAQRLTRLYSQGFRARYAEEFTDLLESEPASAGTIVDVIVAAIRERLSIEGVSMGGRERSVVLMLWAWLAAVGAGINFYFSVDDTPLQVAMRGHGALSTSFELIALAALAGLAAIVGIAAPTAYSGLLAANGPQRRRTVGLLALPFVMATATLGWLTVATVWVQSRWGGAWVPLPWDVGGDWLAPTSWPPPTVRWELSLVTSGFLAIGILTTAMSMRRAFLQLDLSRLQPLWFRRGSVLFACALVTMAVGVLGWGVGAQTYAPAAFHARNGGFFVSTNAVSWAASAIAFTLASLIAIRAARLMVAHQGPLRPLAQG